MHLALNYRTVDPSHGGAETYVADLCRALVLGGHRVDLYAERVADGCLPAGVNVVTVPAPGSTRLERLWNFADLSEQALRSGNHDCSVGFINTWAHDVIIPQGGVQEGSLQANAARFATPLSRQVYRLLKTANPKYWLHRAIEQRQYDRERPARYVAVSQMVRRHLEEFHQVPRQRVHVVPNAIDASRIDVPDPEAVRRKFRERQDLGADDILGLFVGHNFALKGLRPLIAALGRRRRNNPSSRPIHLVVCGGGDAAPYARLAARRGVRDRVHFLGFYPDVRDAYWSCDFFAQPTYYDPCSLVVLEALACGLPVITTEQNGAGELMTGGKHGFILTSPNAETELVAALDRLAGDCERRTMSEEARILGRQQTFDLHVDRLLAVFDEATRCRKARVRPGRWHASSATGAPRAGRDARAAYDQPMDRT
ncbi:MAG: glycosyltransferase family 4 protein [Isosphaeraceae bacterium]